MSGIFARQPRGLGRAAALALVLAGLLGPAATATTPAAAAARPTLTVRAHYVAHDRNIAFTGIALPAGSAMLVDLEFRLEAKGASGWQPISAWMALVTGIGAHWSTDGRYESQLMAMNEPVPAGDLRIEMHVVDSDGGQATAFSNPVHVP
jgi:hypothetical protein